MVDKVVINHDIIGYGNDHEKKLLEQYEKILRVGIDQELPQRSFEVKFVDADELIRSEWNVFEMTDRIFELIGGKSRKIREFKTSETMRKELGSFPYAAGLWEESKKRIIIKLIELQNIEKYASTLLHEVAHAISCAQDVSREFEMELTKLLDVSSSKVFFSSGGRKKVMA